MTNVLQQYILSQKIKIIEKYEETNECLHNFDKWSSLIPKPDSKNGIRSDLPHLVIF